MTAPLLRVVADDYGQHAAIDRGILRLARARRLSAVSCIANGAAWAADAAALRATGTPAGLHLNLTEGVPLSAELRAHWPVLPALPRLIAMAHLRRLPLAALRAEWQAQRAAFEAAWGGPPAHVDGHQHVHHLPQLRGLLAELLDTLPGTTARDTGHARGPGWAAKRGALALTGGRALSRQLQAQGRAQNRVLLGAYDFQAADYGALVRRWLQGLPAEGALLFCHPGEASPGDVIAGARVRELAYLSGPGFPADLQAAGVRLSAPE